MAETKNKVKKIELGLSEFEADDILKQMHLDNVLSAHRALTEMEGTFSPKFPFLVDCMISSLTPYEKQLAMFEMKADLIKESTEGVTDQQEKNEIIMDVNMKIFGICRISFGKYTEKRLAIIR